MIFGHVIPELKMGLASLFAHKLRSLLTMLGMIFGVGAVVAMLSITAGAQKQMMSFIDQLGVNNIIVDAHEAVDKNELQTVRAVSPGMSLRDYRAISENVQGLVAITPRKKFKLQKLLPKTINEPPILVGVYPNFQEINSLKLADGGRFFTAEEDRDSAAVCVLGEGAKVSLFGYGDALGKDVKANDTWLRVIGVLRPQAGGDADMEGVQALNRNNMIIAPFNTVMRRFEDQTSYLKDEIDGIYMKVQPTVDSIETSNVVSALLAATHKDAGDYTITVPEGLLEQKKQTQFIFNIVMICIAGISLLVGGIGIMNIMLATVLERTREIGIRRAIGARQADIVRQFLTEAIMISIAGGLVGIGFGFALSQIIATAAGWSTVVTGSSIAVAFGVSVFIGLLFGIYPAVQAAKLDPIEAIRYE
jgi:putative ABC transport system permease protein